MTTVLTVIDQNQSRPTTDSRDLIDALAVSIWIRSPVCKATKHFCFEILQLQN